MVTGKRSIDVKVVVFTVMRKGGGHKRSGVGLPDNEDRERGGVVNR